MDTTYDTVAVALIRRACEWHLPWEGREDGGAGEKPRTTVKSFSDIKRTWLILTKISDCWNTIPMECTARRVYKVYPKKRILHAIYLNASS